VRIKTLTFFYKEFKKILLFFPNIEKRSTKMTTVKKSTFKNLGDLFIDITTSLPFILFLIVPFMYDTLNGYSIILCFPLAGFFILYSSKTP